MKEPRLRPGDQVRIRGRWWRVQRLLGGSGTTLLEVVAASAAGASQQATFVLAAERIDRALPSAVPAVVTRARWRRLARGRLGSSARSFCTLLTLARSRVSIMPFQLEPALTVTHGLATRLLIADAVGTGKTIQAGLIIAEVLERHPHGRVLIVVPATLREQWCDELRDRFALESTILDGHGLARISAEGPPGGNPWWASRIGITSMDFVKRPETIRALESLVWEVLVLDEAHALAGTSERGQAARSLARRARVVVMLSATPHSGDSDAFARLCATGGLQSDAPLAIFRRGRDQLGPARQRRTCWLRVRLTADELAMHRALDRYDRLVCREQPDSGSHARLVMAVLRKRACSSATSLARSLERRVALLRDTPVRTSIQPALPFERLVLDDEEPLALMAVPGLTDRKAEIETLSGLLDTALRAARAETKPAALCRLLRRTGEPALVFTEYRDTLADLAALLPGAASLHGGLTLRERRETLSAFTSGGVASLLATDAASEGLNLHHRCRLVVNVELPWTPARLEQRVGRVDRFGQPRRVHAVNLVAAGTDEERIAAVLLRKAARARQDLEDGPRRGTRTGEGLENVDEVAARAPEGVAAVATAGRCRDDESDRLSRAARLEADDAALARAVHDGPPAFGRRPMAASAPRRRRTGCELYCAARHTFLDGAGHLLWASVVGARIAITAQRLDSPEALRQLVAHAWPIVAAHLASTQGSQFASAALPLQRYVNTCRRRERDIAAALHQSTARLASIQAGLFDRREERQAAAQRAVLLEALHRCDERLRRLIELEHARTGPTDLIAAIAL